VGVLKEKGYAKSRIGTIGMKGGGTFTPRGYISHALWTDLTEVFPRATFLELWEQFVPHFMTKSEEDLALFRYVAAITEAACQVAMDVSKPGVSELELYEKVQHVFLRHGASSTGMILHSDPGNIGHFYPKWLHRAQKPRVLQSGDTIHMELFGNVGAAHAQAQLCIALGPVSDEVHRAGALAREAYEICLKTLRPGIRFEEVAEAMDQPIDREGAWRLTPMLHSQSPIYCVGPESKRIENMPGLKERYRDFLTRPCNGADVVLRPGMIFQVEPNACFSRHYVDIGGNMIVTEKGCEELNTIPCHLRFVKG